MHKLLLLLTIIVLSARGNAQQSPPGKTTLAKGKYESIPIQGKARTVYVFDGLTGPSDRCQLPPLEPARWLSYSNGSASRLAVLLTDTNSQWLGIAHGLRTIGIPFIITTDVKRAALHSCVLVYPRMGWLNLSKSDVKILADIPARGGTLITCSAEGRGIQEIFGIAGSVPSFQHRSIDFSPEVCKACLFEDPRESTLSLKADTLNISLGSHSYSGSSEAPLATFEDGSAAIIQQTFSTRSGSGHAYAIGLDVGYLLLTAYNNRENHIARAYVNEFEPGVDLLLRLLKRFYTSSFNEAVTISTVPSGKDLSVLLTHDIDYTASMKNALDYAEYEKKNGIAATYFIQTKYIKDWNDNLFLNDTGVLYLQRLEAMGVEIASHSVSHSRIFSKFPLGDGAEIYPAYLPFVKDAKETYNGTIFGELRTSKFLLEYFTDQTVVSFRPGHLQNPYQLPEALTATGYKYSSSVTANNSLTHLPFQLNYRRGRGAETPIFEFPITIEDEEQPRMDQRLPQAIQLAEKLKQYGGIFVILIHPNVIDFKLDFEQGFVEALKPFAWFGTMRSFGDWWSARNEVQIDIDKNSRTVDIVAPIAIENLAIQIPKGWVVEGDGLQQNGRTVVIQKLEGNRKLKFQ